MIIIVRKIDIWRSISTSVNLEPSFMQDFGYSTSLEHCWVFFQKALLTFWMLDVSYHLDNWSKNCYCLFGRKHIHAHDNGSQNSSMKLIKYKYIPYYFNGFPNHTHVYSNELRSTHLIDLNTQHWTQWFILTFPLGCSQLLLMLQSDYCNLRNTKIEFFNQFIRAITQNITDKEDVRYICNIPWPHYNNIAM